MKKIIIMMTFVCAAVAAQAVSVSWKVTGDASDTGSTVYLMIGQTPVEEWASLAAIQAAALDSGTMTKVGRSYQFSSTLNIGSLSSDSYLFVLKVAADKATFAVGSAQQIDSSTTDIAWSSANFFIAGKAFGGSSEEGGGSTPEASPEPTSGLLMLLGLAGLALRRRRA